MLGKEREGSGGILLANTRVVRSRERQLGGVQGTQGAPGECPLWNQQVMETTLWVKESVDV